MWLKHSVPSVQHNYTDDCEGLAVVAHGSEHLQLQQLLSLHFPLIHLITSNVSYFQLRQNQTSILLVITMTNRFSTCTVLCQPICHNDTVNYVWT